MRGREGPWGAAYAYTSSGPTHKNARDVKSLFKEASQLVIPAI
jgi:hypothetical protein